MDGVEQSWWIVSHSKETITTRVPSTTNVSEHTREGEQSVAVVSAYACTDLVAHEDKGGGVCAWSDVPGGEGTSDVAAGDGGDNGGAHDGNGYRGGGEDVYGSGGIMLVPEQAVMTTRTKYADTASEICSEIQCPGSEVDNENGRGIIDVSTGEELGSRSRICCGHGSWRNGRNMKGSLHSLDKATAPSAAVHRRLTYTGLVPQRLFNCCLN